MTTRTPPDYPLIKRIMEECERYGGDPKELARQLSLNRNLEERNHELQELNNSLTRTRDSILARIQELQKQEAEANQLRDNAIEGSNTLNKEVNAKRKEFEDIQSKLAQRLNTTNEWESVHRRVEEELTRLNQALNSAKNALGPALWARSVLEQRRPILFDLEREYVIDFLNKKQPTQPYTDEIGTKIIDLLIDELKRRGTLVPKFSYDVIKTIARLCADKTRYIEQAVQQFARAPVRMTVEQRRALLIGFIIAGVDSKEKFDELQKQAAETGAQCPIHHIKLAWNQQLNKWMCTVLNCKFDL